MKKWFILLAVCTLPMMAMAQKSALVGAWQQLDANGRPTTQFKFFMPDGRLLGLSYNSDLTNSSVWFMSDYTVLNDTSYVDHAFYHSNIGYQRDYLFTFHQENDSVMVTNYVDYRTNNNRIEMTERWKKSDRPLPVYTDAEWQALLQKSLVEFDRLPAEGQTVEQYAQKLYDKAEDYKKSNKLVQACEALLIRAELDTTNLQWQKDAYDLFIENRSASSVAEKMANRYIRLKEAIAPAANDTSVVNAYRTKAGLYLYRGNAAKQQFREYITKTIALETSAGLQPSKDYGYDYLVLAMSYMNEGDFEVAYDNILKSIDIMEKASDVSKLQLSEAYIVKAVVLRNMKLDREAIDLALNKTVPLLNDESGQENLSGHVYPFILNSYETLLEKTPKDKKLLKEYQQFLSDKLLYDVFHSTDKKRNLFGKYLVLERGQWTLEKPTATFDDTYMLIQQDGKYMDFTKEEGEETEGMIVLEVVDAAKKKDIIKQWKAYRKSNPK